MLYLFVVLILLCCIYVYDIRKKCRYKYVFFDLIVLILILLNIFSYNIGGDTDEYMHNWLFYKSIFDDNLFDEINIRGFKEQPGWIFLTSLLKGMCDNFIILRIVLACWVNLVIAHFFRENTQLIFTSLLMYFIVSYFNYNFEILRESVSITFFLLSYPFYLEGRWGKYFVCFLMAFMFHESSLVMLLLPIFRLFENMSTKKILIMMSGIYVVLISLNFVDVLMKWLPDSFAFYDKAYMYMNSDIYGENKRVNMFLSFFPSFLIPLFSFLILRNNPQKRTLSVFIIASIVFNIMTTKMYIFYRFNNYVSIPLIVAYSEIMYMISRKIVLKNMRMFALIPVLLLYISYKIFSVYLVRDGGDKIGARFFERYYPYTSILDKN